MPNFKYANTGIEDLMKELPNLISKKPSTTVPGNAPAAANKYFNKLDFPTEFKELFEGIDTPVDMPLSDSQEEALEEAPTSGYRAPIRGALKSSGDYSPGVATDARHSKGHNGVDLRAPEGTALYPMAPGIVTKVDSTPIGGNSISIEHADNVKTYYAHCADVKVQKGQKVGYDTVIGTVGTSGNAKGTWPHVHFQVWKNEQLQDPNNFFTVPKYSKLEKNEQRYLKQEDPTTASDKILKIQKLANYYYQISKF